MPNRYTSEQLLQELPRPLLNFLWYLWDTYCDPDDPEFRITLQDTEDTNGQRFFIHGNGKTLTQDFGCHIAADIVIRKDGARYFMGYG